MFPAVELAGWGIALAICGVWLLLSDVDLAGPRGDVIELIWP